MTLANGAVYVPNVRIDIADPRGTNRPVFAPIYEQPLLERLWDGTNATVEVTKIPERGPGGRPWPADMLGQYTTAAEEEGRLKKKYGRHPSTKEPLFERVYGFGVFHETFQRVVSGTWTAPGQAAPGPEPEKPSVHPAMQQQVEEPAEEPAADEEPTAEKTVEKTVEKTEAIISDDDGMLDSEAAEAPPPAWQALTTVKGVGDELAQALYEDGVTSIDEIASMPLLELKAYMGVGEKSGQRILDSAGELAMAGMEG